MDVSRKDKNNWVKKFTDYNDSEVRGKPLQLGRTYHRRRTLTTTTTTTVLRPFVRDYPGEPVPEETPS